jgi:hypothetical protein
LFQRKLPDAFEQLLTRDVVRAFPGLLPQLDREIERIAEEEIGLAIEPGILLHDVVKLFTEIEFLHRWMDASEAAGKTRVCADIRRT